MNDAEVIKKIRILNVGVSRLTRTELVELVVKWSRADQKRTLLYANAHILNLACNHLALQKALNTADLVFADGVGVVWAARILHRAVIEKLVCRVWVELFFSQAVQTQRKIFILAGKPGVAEIACQVIRQKFPGIQIVGTHHGYFRPEDTQELINRINASLPDLLFVGMGTPNQELWLSQHREQISAPVCCAVGAYFDYHAGLEKSVPEWINRLGLEWLWRLALDPKGKWQRYIVGNPRFVFRILQERLFQNAK